MAKLETQPAKNRIDEAVAFSRKLPQIGIHPEVALQVGKEMLERQKPATDWEQARAKTMQKEPNRK